MAALALFGWFVGLSGAVCGLSAVHFNRAAAETNLWLLAVAAAALLTLGAAPRFLRDWAPNRVLALSAGVGIAGVVTFAAAYADHFTYFGGALLGLAVGLAAFEASRQIGAYGEDAVGGKAADLAACSWPAGAAAACLIAAAGRSLLSFASLWMLVAVFLGAFAIVSLRMRSQSPPPLSHRTLLVAQWRQAALNLQFGSALFQALFFGIVAAWLGLYMSRKVGLTAAAGTAALGLVWLAVLGGRAVASRYKNAMPLKMYPAFLLIWIVGALFMANTISLSGAFAASLLLGFGAGALQPLSGVPAFSAFSPGAARVSAVLFEASVVAALAGVLLGGRLVQQWGMDSLVWAALAAQVLTGLTSFGAALEARIFQGLPVDTGRPA